MIKKIKKELKKKEKEKEKETNFGFCWKMWLWEILKIEKDSRVEVNTSVDVIEETSKLQRE